MSTSERMGLGWVLWVSGWSLLVGSVLFVLPTYLMAGTEVALWLASGVAFVSLCLTWLAAEAGHALNAERASEPELLSARPLSSKHS